MHETIIPTHGFRWLQRWVAVSTAPADIMQFRFGAQYPRTWQDEWVLQQAWVSSSGQVVWQDIPREETPRPPEAQL